MTKPTEVIIPLHDTGGNLYAVTPATGEVYVIKKSPSGGEYRSKITSAPKIKRLMKRAAAVIAASGTGGKIEP